MSIDEGIRVIRECLEADRVQVLPHFIDRLHQRGLMWPDVLMVIENPGRVAADGLDDFDRPRFLIRGRLTDGLRGELVAVIDQDDVGKLTIFITAYFD